MRILLLLLFFIPLTGHACFNDFVHDASGKAVTNKELEDIIYTRNFNFRELDKKIAAFENKAGAKTYKDSSDFAVVLAKRGYVYRALNILETIAKRMPDDYTIAANLGTCYELVGKNEAALAWIKKGIRINPKSHRGSEWVHVKILEAKIALAKDAGWLASHKVLDLPGQVAPVKADPDKKGGHRDEASQKFDSLERHVIYQLKERLPFMTPPDAIMAAVLKELAYYEEQSAIEVSIMHYTYAQEYAGGSDSDLKQRIRTMNNRFDSLIQVARKKEEHDGIFDHRSPYVAQQMFARSKAYKVLDSATVVKPLEAEPKADTVKADTIKPTAAAPVGTTTPEKQTNSSMMWLFIAGGIVIIGAGMWLMRRR